MIAYYDVIFTLPEDLSPPIRIRGTKGHLFTWARTARRAVSGGTRGAP